MGVNGAKPDDRNVTNSDLSAVVVKRPGCSVDMRCSYSGEGGLFRGRG
jgi:hypothetical protein